MITKEQKQQLSAGCLLGLGILGLLICAFARGYQEFKKADKSNDKIIQTIKSSLNKTL